MQPLIAYEQLKS
jgi:hypothetical protein